MLPLIATIFEMKRSASKVNVKTESGDFTIEEAFQRSAIPEVTPSSKVKREEVDLTGADDSDDDDKTILQFNYDDYKEMEQIEVVINAQGDSVNIHAPKMAFFPPPSTRFTDHHIFFKCETPSKNYKDKTVIPMRGMFGFLFYEKNYIKCEHEILNRKINAWRIEMMKAFAKIRQDGEVLQDAIDCQETYIRDKVGVIQKHIASFDYCHISILNKESIHKLLLLDNQPEQSSLLVYMFCKHHCIHVYTKPSTKYKIDLVTRFDRDPRLDVVFGKQKCDLVKGRAYGNRLRIKDH